MSNSTVKESKKLQGKSNIVEWTREFEQEAKKKDVLELIRGKEAILAKPQMIDFVTAKVGELTKVNKVKSDLKTGDAKYQPENLDAALVQLLFSEANMNWKENKEKIQTATELLYDWISEGVKIQISECENIVEAYKHIHKTYELSDERKVERLQEKVSELTLKDCDGMQDYVNTHRKLRSDLKKAGQTYTDKQMVSNLFFGLPHTYDTFKKAYRFTHKKDDKPDVEDLVEALLEEEDDGKKQKKFNSSKRSTGIVNNNSNNGGGNKPFNPDRPPVKCTFSDCGRWGHTEDRCWVKDPSLKPKAVRDKEARLVTNNKPKNKAGKANNTTISDEDMAHFMHLFSNMKTTDQTGMLSSASQNTNPTDCGRQTSKDRAQGQGESGNGKAGCRKESIAVDCHTETKQSGLAFIATNTNQKNKDTWLVDTGANMHIVNDTKWFLPNTFHDFDLTIHTADKSTALKIGGGGRVKLPLLCDGQVSVITLDHVAYAPNARCNLFSPTKLKLKGEFDEDHMVLRTRSGQSAGHANCVKGLFELDLAFQYSQGKCDSERPQTEDTAVPMAANINWDDPVWKWHRRLGHMSFQNMKKLLKSCEGLELTSKQIQAKLKAICPVCATTRAQNRIPRDPARRQTTEPGQLIHCDTWGPYQVIPLDGTRYILYFTDDKTRFTWSARVRQKGDLPEVFIRLHTLIETSLGITIRNYRFDGEFWQGRIKQWLTARGVGAEPSVAYAHHQNGAAERNNRTIREKAAPLIQEYTISGQTSRIINGRAAEDLREKTLPKKLWPDAIEQAVWLKNRSPSKALKKSKQKTPWEALYQQVPNLQHERIWGSRAYVTIPPELRGQKLHSPRGYIGYFVGCEAEDVYKIYSPDKQRVFRVSVARIEDGQGLDDSHDEPHADRTARVIPITDAAEEDDESTPSEADDTDSEAESSSEIVDGVAAMVLGDAIDEDSPFEGFSTSDNADHVGEDCLDDNQSDSTSGSVSPIVKTYDPDQGPKAFQKWLPSLRATGKSDKFAWEMLNDGTCITQKIDPGAEQSPENQTFANLLQKWAYAPASDDEPTTGTETVRQAGSGTGEMAKKGMVYYPDDSRCDYCFRRFKHCDKDQKGMPCTHCVRNRAKCIEQTQETKSLILPENRHVKKQISNEVTGPPCRRCWQKAEPCRRPGGLDKPCRSCTSAGHRCNPDLTGAKRTARVQAKVDKRMQKQKQVPFERRCRRCQKNHLRCDGNKPCNYCRKLTYTSRRCSSETEFQNRKQKHGCAKCRGNGLFCDKERPCSTCVNSKRHCTYIDQDGLVSRTYEVPEASKSIYNFPNESESDQQDCTRCAREKKNCDQEQPCRHCVSKSYRCVYRQKGLMESYEAAPYRLEEDFESGGDRIVLDEDWKNILANTGRQNPAAPGTGKPRKSKPTSQEGIVETLHESTDSLASSESTDSISDIDDGEDIFTGGTAAWFASNLRSTKPKVSNKATSQPTQEQKSPPVQDSPIEITSGSEHGQSITGLHQTTAPAQQPHAPHAGETTARQILESMYPAPQRERIAVSGDGYLCAIRAAIATWEALDLQGVVIPTEDELVQILYSDELAAWRLEFYDDIADTIEEEDGEGISIDILGRILHIWTRDNGGLPIRVGVTIRDGATWLQSFDTGNEVEPNGVTIWIENDNARSKAKKSKAKNTINHFSGLKRVNTGQAALNTQKKKIDPPKTSVDDDIEAFVGSPKIQKTIQPPAGELDDDWLFFQETVLEDDPFQNDTESESDIEMMAALSLQDASTVDSTKLPEPNSYAEAMRGSEAAQWKAAINSELSSLESNKTWEVVPKPEGMKLVTSKFIFKRKMGDTGEVTRHKARLVARGFQQLEGIDFQETFAAVVKPTSFNVLMAIAAMRGWSIHQMDVKTAFLNGQLSQPAYVSAPAGMRLPKGMCLLVKKALYGLKPSPRAWADKWTETMIKNGLRVSSYDPCVFIHEQIELIVIIWVDDILIFGKDEDIRNFKTGISSIFQMTDEGPSKYYLGMHIEEDEEAVYVHQRQYTEQILNKYGYAQATSTKTPCDPARKLTKAKATADAEFKTDFQAKVGSVNYLANRTRPDISFSVGMNARYASNPDQSHMDSITRAFQYAKDEPARGLRYLKQSDLSTLAGYVDSDYANCEDTRRSTTGWIFMLAGGPISWCSQRQKTVATSTMDAEYIAAAEAAKEAVWIRGFINDLDLSGLTVKSVPLYIDNNSALKLTKNPEFHSRAKHIDVKHHFIREKVASGEIDTIRVSTAENIADILTKALGRTIHERHVNQMGLRVKSGSGYSV